MKPYYSDDAVTIYCGDCREVLPSLPAGVLVTDPVWPQAVTELQGADRPEALFAEMWARGDFYRSSAARHHQR